MEDGFTGKGILRRLEHPVAEWTVTYRFSNTTVEDLRSHSGAARIESEGRVATQNGIAIPEGYYQLTAEHGEIRRVKNLGIGHWTMLAPP